MHMSAYSSIDFISSYILKVYGTASIILDTQHQSRKYIENRAMTSFQASLDETLRESLGDSESLG